MKLVLVDEDGIVLNVIEDVEQYDMRKPLARAALVAQVIEIVAVSEGLSNEDL